MGLKEEWARKWQGLLDSFTPWGICGLTGQGTTNSANMLCLRALRLSLEHNYTDATFAKMFASMDRLEQGMKRVIEKHSAPFRIDAEGARLNVAFTPDAAYDALSGKGIGLAGIANLALPHVNRGGVDSDRQHDSHRTRYDVRRLRHIDSALGRSARQHVRAVMRLR